MNLDLEPIDLNQKQNESLSSQRGLGPWMNQLELVVTNKSARTSTWIWRLEKWNKKKKQLEGNLERGKIMSTRIETRASGRRRFDCRGREKKKSGENRTWKKKMINYETNNQVAPNPVTRWQWFSLQLLLETKASSGDWLGATWNEACRFLSFVNKKTAGQSERGYKRSGGSSKSVSFIWAAQPAVGAAPAGGTRWSGPRAGRSWRRRRRRPGCGTAAESASASRSSAGSRPLRPRCHAAVRAPSAPPTGSADCSWTRPPSVRPGAPLGPSAAWTPSVFQKKEKARVRLACST